MATKNPTIIAGAEEPATLSGLCHPMAIAMVGSVGNVRVNGSEVMVSVVTSFEIESWVD